jgi:hypothetical protein
MFKCSCSHKITAHVQSECKCPTCVKVRFDCWECSCMLYDGPYNNIEYLEQQADKVDNNPSR